jgi:hypothetical protein
MADTVRLWGAVEFKPDLNFYHQMYRVAKAVGHDFEHWWTDRLTVVVHDYKRRESLRFNSQRISFEALNSEDIPATFQTLSETLRNALKDLGYRQLRRLGLKLSVYTDLGLSFDEIRAQVSQLCLPPQGELERLTSGKLTDLDLKLHYRWKDNTALLRISPMNKEQGLLDIRGVGDISKLFPDPAKTGDLHEFLASIPDSFLALDVDVFTEKKHSGDEWLDFVSDVVPYLLSVCDTLKDRVLERNRGTS